MKLMLVDKDKELLEKYCVFARAGARTRDLFVHSLTLFHCTKTPQVIKGSTLNNKASSFNNCNVFLYILPMVIPQIIYPKGRGTEY
jgi:hypothetical protein